MTCKIAIRVDAAHAIGRGHAMRCLSLANGLRRWNNQPVFICRELAGDLIEFIRSQGYLVYSFTEGDDVANTLAIFREIGKIDTLIVDHYALDKTWETKIRPFVSTLVVIDDLAKRSHDCDLLIDPSLGKVEEDYQDLIPKDCELLLGSAYVLLSDAYSSLRYSALDHRKNTKEIRRILISMGGTDPNNATSLAIDALSQIETKLNLDVVLSSDWGHFEIVKEQLARMHHCVQLHINITNLAECILSADLAIGAGGVSAYERCCLGLPTLLFVIADNQYHNARALDREKAAVFLGAVNDLSIEFIKDKINALIKNLDEWRSISNAAAFVCDGYGVNRVVARLLSEKSDVALRLATWADSEIIFEWQQDPSTRQYARNANPPTRNEHEQWFCKHLDNPDYLFNIIIKGNEPVGVLRFDRLLDKENTFEISILVSPDHRNKGIAASALQLARKLYPNLIFYAEVHPDNKPSHKLFQSAGYVFKETGYFSYAQ